MLFRPIISNGMVFSKWLAEKACYTSEIELCDVDLVSSLPSYEISWATRRHRYLRSEWQKTRVETRKTRTSSLVFRRSKHLTLPHWAHSRDQIPGPSESWPSFEELRFLAPTFCQKSGGRRPSEVSGRRNCWFQLRSFAKKGCQGLKTQPIGVYPDGDSTGISTRNIGHVASHA